MVMVDRFGQRTSFGKLGVMSGRPISEPVPALQIPGEAIKHTAAMVELLVDSLGQIITGARPIAEIGGPLKIAQYSG